MKEYFFKRPMLLSAVCCVVISIAGYCGKIPLLCTGVLLALAVGVMVLTKAGGRLIFAMLLTLVMLISTVITRGKIAAIESVSNRSVTADLTIYEITYEGSDYYSAKAYVTDAEALENGTKIRVFYPPLDLRVGEILNAEFKPKTVPDDYKASSCGEEIYLTANLKNIKRTGKSNFVLKSVGKVRRYIKRTLYRNLGYEEAATLCALTFGDRSRFSDEFYRSVRSAGAAHVMVVSGMHLSILVLIFSRIGRKLVNDTLITAFAMLAAVFLLCTLCGFTMSIIRAGVTYVIAATAIIIKRRDNPANNLGAAVTLILICSPFAVLSVAFELSVLSTFGILAIALPAVRYITANKMIESEFTASVIFAVLVTLGATLMTLPVAVFVFGEVSTVGVITNLLITYAVTLLLWLAVCGLGVNLIFPALARLIFIPVNLIAKYVNSVIYFFGSLKFSVVPLKPQFAGGAVIAVIVIFWIFLACKNRNDMLKSGIMRRKIEWEGGKRLRWR